MVCVASTLGMTDRTLRRRLQQEGTSFHVIIDDVRYSLAKEYLHTTRMTADDIALVLGFSDTANFRRAFKRWSGMATSQYRTSVAGKHG